MSRTIVKRKAARWESYQPPREWVAYLECGHKTPQDWDDARMGDERKEALEKSGDVECFQCGEKKAEIDGLKALLKELEKS